MESLKEFYELHKKQIICFLLLIVIVLTCLTFFKIEKKFKKDDKTAVASLVEKKTVNSEEAKEQEVIIPKTIKVDVKGYVVNEGVYSLNEDARVIDAINMAGGLKEEAYTRYINLSKKLNDEDIIIVNSKEEVEALKTEEIRKEQEEKIYCEPINKACESDDNVITSSFIEEKPKEEKPATNTSVKEDKEENKENDNDKLNTLVNINTASKETLMTVKGIGESKAEKIIEYRNTHGNFESIESIKNVSGIGESMYEKIKNLITVG